MGLSAARTIEIEYLARSNIIVCGYTIKKRGLVLILNSEYDFCLLVHLRRRREILLKNSLQS